MEILRIEDLSFRYAEAEQNAVEHVNLSLESGEFIVVCGESGCGKTTLLKLFKRELAPAGNISGKIYYKGILQQELDEKMSACEIGYVLQNPDNQIVTDKVWHELAFGLENMGIPTEVIRRRVGEMAGYFGIESWFRKNTDELSGGQKQLLNLASVMVMQPEILILDEPTSQLDPIAAADFIATLQKLNRELGLTIILVEHRLEEVFRLPIRFLLWKTAEFCFMPRQEIRRFACRNTLRINRCSRTAERCEDIRRSRYSDECPLTVRGGQGVSAKIFFRYGLSAEVRGLPTERGYCHRAEGRMVPL